MGDLLTEFANWLSPVVVIYGSIGSIISFLLGALANPNGLWNRVVNKGIDVFVSLLPVHPPELTLGAILANADTILPGYAPVIISETAVTISSIFAIIALIKIYKLIPFKFS